MTASTHDSQHFDAVLDAGNTRRDVFADRGYASQLREVQLRDQGLRDQLQRKGQRMPDGQPAVTGHYQGVIDNRRPIRA